MFEHKLPSMPPHIEDKNIIKNLATDIAIKKINLALEILKLIDSSELDANIVNDALLIIVNSLTLP